MVVKVAPQFRLEEELFDNLGTDGSADVWFLDRDLLAAVGGRDRRLPQVGVSRCR